MQTNSNINFLHNHEIDKRRWDECVVSSPNGLIYARSFYLDNICSAWYALTGNNYEWVFPITHNRKWGISYLYQPPFTQQLGVFAKPGINPPFVSIINWLKKNFKFWEINWNYATDKSCFYAPINLTSSTNFILDLSKDYEIINKNYHKHLHRKLNRSKQFNQNYQSTGEYEQYIELYLKSYGVRTPHVKRKDYERLKNICAFAIRHGMLICRQVVNKDNELLALVLLFKDRKRLYNLINMTTEAGRKTEANHFLLDSVICEFAGRELLFDFEGSDLPGVKTFYSYFGAVNQPYFKIKYNALPWPARWIKK